MASDDIAVPDLAYFIEHDLRAAIRQMDEEASMSVSPVSDATFNFPATSAAVSLPSNASVPVVKPKAKKSKKKKKKTTTPKEGPKTVRKFATPYAVFADVRKQALKAAHPDRKGIDMCKQIAKEWGKMTRFEKAPYKKEFEDRLRLFELEHSASEAYKAARPIRQGVRSTFKFAPHRSSSNKEKEISRIEHLPHCPIIAKRKVYEESVLKPFMHPRQEVSEAGPSGASTSCRDCPKSYAVCDYCRGLGINGPKIFHFESDCWMKARHLEHEASRKLKTSLERRSSTEIDTRTRHNSSSRQASNHSTFNEPLSSTKHKPLKTAIDLDDLFGDDDPITFDIPARRSLCSLPSSTLEATSADGEMPDLSVIDDFLSSVGLGGSTSSSAAG